MELENILNPTSSSVKFVYTLAVSIRDSETANAEFKKAANAMAQEFTNVGSLLDQLRNMIHRLDANDKQLLIGRIKLVRTVMTDAENVLNEVKRNRNFFQRLFMKTETYRQQLHDIKQHLNQTCLIIQNAIPKLHKKSIPFKQFADFRKLFQQIPDKTLAVFDFSIIRDKPNSIATINMDEFDKTFACYMKLNQSHIIFSHQARTWSSLLPKDIILEQRREQFHLKYSTAKQTPTTPQLNERLEFTEYFITHDDICGMALTKTLIYIATEHEITILSLTNQQIIAQNGSQGEGNKTFKHISSLYISSNDETNLYIVDRGQCAVHHYKINDQGTCFDFVDRYIVIANVNETPNLVSCVIYNNKLIVSDDANNCLHIFDLNEKHQSLYVCDNSMTPFSPGSLSATDKYLYVANCSLESPCIIIFDEEYNPVDCFRNKLFEQILAMDLCPNINELFILTTTNFNSMNTERKRPLIVTTDLCIRAK
jgi:hypothetical protein